MKLLSLGSLAFLVSLYSPITMAIEPLMAGHYHAGGYEKLATVSVFSIFTGSQAGKSKVTSLKNNGYSCKYIMRETYRCSKSIDEDGADLSAQLEARLPFQEFKVDAARGEAFLVYSSDTITEWEMPQSIRFNDGKHFDSYRVLETQGLKKIFLGKPALYTFLPTDSSDQMSFPMDVSITVSKEEFRIYLLAAFFHLAKE